MKKNRPLHIIIIDDSKMDVQFLVRALKNGGFEPDFVRIDSAQELEEALEDKTWEIAISDYHMPNFSAENALKLWQQKMGDAPFIVVSGAIVDEDAVSLLRSGAHDFIRKDKLARLTPAIDRELREVEGRRKRREAEQAVILLNATLEQRVIERTTELQDSLAALKRTQNQLVESQKMAALGCLVTGVAHEINTPLGIGITATSHLYNATKQMSNNIADDSTIDLPTSNYIKLADESLEMIGNSLKKVADLVRSFKNIAVDQASGDRRKFYLKEQLEEILLIYNPRIKNTQHKVEITCPQDLVINSFPGAISEVIVNLLSNSIKHGFEDISKGTIEIIAIKNAGKLQLIYSDNGKGMDEKKVDRLFEPFFTTKRGQGNIGLGMNVVYNLVNHTLGGQITCKSKLGEGVDFTITFQA
ncbi:MAG: response regulator [Magnetococcales bacterium]|nr:response regulator [Magnetococcales bacterium]